MHKADGPNTTSPVPVDVTPLTTETSTIELLKRIADTSASAMIGEGAVHPDQALLDLCDQAMRQLRQATALETHWLEMKAYPGWMLPGTPGREARIALHHQNRRAAALFRRAAKLKATTGAGLLAKALLVSGSYTGAAKLGQSLAADLLECKAVRLALTPPPVREGV